jgi:hypothetical protein
MSNDNHLKKIEPINRLLESRFGIRITSASLDHLVEVRNHYDAKRNHLLSALGEAQAMLTPEYAKAVLISEAVRLIIREIAPKRIKKRRK